MAAEGQQPGLDDRKAVLVESAFFGPNKQYVRWDTGLHEVFEEAVEALGGAHAAKPANIRDKMGVPLLTTAQVKSHLQKHRIRVVAERGTKDATEAQARAAVKLLERQKRQVESALGPARPRVLLPIRGSRQMSGALATSRAAFSSGGDDSKRPKRRARKRRAYSESFSSSDEDGDYEPVYEDWEQEADVGGEGEDSLRLARRSQRGPRRRRRRHENGSAYDSNRDTDGEGRSAGTTTASPSHGGGNSSRQRGSAQEVEALPFMELSRMLSTEGVNMDPATIMGLAQRRVGFLAAASAAAEAAGMPLLSVALPPIPCPLPIPAAASQPVYESSGKPATTHQTPFLASNGISNDGASGLSVNGTVATLNRQVQLEHALLEQSMWVQKLVAEVQDLRNRQRLGLPVPPPDSTALSSPFALMAQAEFPGDTEPSPLGRHSAPLRLPQQQQRRRQQHQTQQPKASGTLATCDSTPLRLLSSTLGGQVLGGGQAHSSPWSWQEASDAALMLLQGMEAASAATERTTSMPVSQTQAAPAQNGAANQLTCDSGLLCMLSQLLGEAAWQHPDDGAAANNDTAVPAAAALTAAAARFAAEAGHSSAGSTLAAAAATAAATGSQVLPPPPVLPPVLPHSLGGGGRPPLGLGLPPPLPSAPNSRQTSLDIFNNGLVALGLAGSTAAASQQQPRAVSTSEFLRLCSLASAADVLPAVDQ